MIAENWQRLRLEDLGETVTNLFTEVHTAVNADWLRERILSGDMAYLVGGSLAVCYRVGAFGFNRDLVVTALAGKLPDGLGPDDLDAELTAKAREFGARRVVFVTRREGVAQMAASMGYALSEVVMAKGVE